MAAGRRSGRKTPLGLERSAVYLARARESQAQADAATLPHVRRKHLAVAARWLEFAERARRVEADED